MQLQDLFKRMEDMTDEELQERLRQVRHNRKTVRPAAKAHAKRSANKETRADVSKAEQMIKKLGLTPEQILELLGGSNGDE